MCTGYSVGKDCGHRLRGRNQVGSCTGKTVICQLLPFHPNLKYWRHCGIMPKPDCCCVICTTAVLYARLLLCYMHNCCVICTTAAVLYARLLCVTCTTRVSTVVQLGLCPQKRKEKKGYVSSVFFVAVGPCEPSGVARLKLAVKPCHCAHISC